MARARTGQAMAAKRTPNLSYMLDRLAAAGRKEKDVPVRHIRDEVGPRSFGPLLLAASLVGLTPIGAAPGIPSLLALFIGLIAAQMLFGRQSLWLPGFLLNRKIEGKKLVKGARKLRGVAQWLDGYVGPRLEGLTRRPSSYIVAAVCLAIALTVPPFELLPFVDLPLWGALVAFGLALTTHDGLLAIAAFVLTATGIILTVAVLLY